MSDEHKKEELEQLNEEFEALGIKNPFITSAKKLAHRPIPIPEKEFLNEEVKKTLSEWQEEYNPSKDQITRVLGLATQTARAIYDKEEFTFFDLVDLAGAFKIDGKVAATVSPKLKTRHDSDGKLSGATALQAHANKRGFSKPTRVPLYASCMAVEIAGIGPNDIIELAITLAETNLEIGANTKGLIYTVSDARIRTVITDFIATHIKRSTLIDHTPENFLKVLRVVDLDALFAGALSSMYPNGYPIALTCASSECGYEYIKEVNEENRNMHFGHMMVTPSSKLSAKQLRSVLGGYGTRTIEQILEIQEEISPKKKVDVIADEDGIQRFTFQSPLFMDYVNIADDVLSEVTKIVDRTISQASNKPLKERKRFRRQYLEKALSAQRLRLITPWVYEIEEEAPGEEPDVYAPSAVGDLLGNYSDPDQIKAIIDAHSKFKMDNIFTVVGYNSYHCTHDGCDTDQAKEYGEHYNSFVMLDVSMCFFDIMVLRAQM